jgi:hypothetical protein
MAVIHVIFAGLIAFVPNGSETASSVTAYLVKATDHVKPTLKIYGDAAIAAGGGGTVCQKVDRVITCNLADTNIDIENLTTASLTLPRKPPEHRLPNPAIVGDVHSLDWLVRMSNVEKTGIGHADPDKLKDKTGARMTFMSDDLSASELDGSEAGTPELIGIGPLLRQVVSESLLLNVRVNSEQVVIKLVDRPTGKTQTITAACRDGACVGLEITNNYTGVSICADGDHFKHYYDLVKQSGRRFLPVSMNTRRPCLKGEGRRVDVEFIKHILQVVRPIAPDKADQFVAKLADKEFVKKLKTHKKLKNQIYAPLWDAIQDFLKVQDRIICPPVLLESP